MRFFAMEENDGTRVLLAVSSIESIVVSNAQTPGVVIRTKSGDMGVYPVTIEQCVEALDQLLKSEDQIIPLFPAKK